MTRGALWAVDLGDEVLCLPPAAYELREADSGEAASLAAAAGLGVDELAARFRRGSRAFVAVRGEEVAAWVWTSRGEEYAPPLGRTFHFAGDEAYAWNGGTRPEHRGHCLLGALLRLAGRTLAGEGVRLMWCGIRDKNLASQRATGHAGWRPVMRTVALHVGSVPLLWCDPVRYADPRLVERAYRVVGRRRPSRPRRVGGVSMLRRMTREEFRAGLEWARALLGTGECDSADGSDVGLRREAERRARRAVGSDPQADAENPVG